MTPGFGRAFFRQLSLQVYARHYSGSFHFRFFSIL